MSLNDASPGPSVVTSETVGGDGRGALSSAASTAASAPSSSGAVPHDAPAQSADGGPGGEHSAYELMDVVCDRLQLLDCEHRLCRSLHAPPVGRHLFVDVPAAAAGGGAGGRRFFMFVSVAAWLLRLLECHVPQPHERDDPAAVLAAIVDGCQRCGVGELPFAASRLKSGGGWHALHVLDRLTLSALQHVDFRWQTAQMPPPHDEETGEAEYDAVTGEHSEITTHNSQQAGLLTDEADGEELHGDASVDENDDGDEDGVDNSLEHDDEDDAAPLMTLRRRPSATAAPATAAAVIAGGDEQWRSEVERVLPQLRMLQLDDNAAAWRGRLRQMCRHGEQVGAALHAAAAQLTRLSDQSSDAMTRIGAREKLLNSRLHELLSERRELVEQMNSVQQQYSAVSGGVLQRSQQLQQLVGQLQLLQRQLEQRGAAVTDASRLVQVRRAVGRVRADLRGVCVRVGVVEHALQQYRLADRRARPWGTAAGGTDMPSAAGPPTIGLY